MKSLSSHINEAFIDEEYWKVNVDTSNIFPCKKESDAISLLSGRQYDTVKTKGLINATDVFGKSFNISSNTILDVYYLVNSDNKHFIFVQTLPNQITRYFPSDYRGTKQTELIDLL